MCPESLYCLKYNMKAPGIAYHSDGRSYGAELGELDKTFLMQLVNDMVNPNLYLSCIYKGLFFGQSSDKFQGKI
jgi:hypothetical protein